MEQSAKQFSKLWTVRLYLRNT